MVSFKLAAIKVLQEANEALHYDEITKRALEQGLIETSG
ncbi:MAG: HTH domain-containing protein, partial [Halobacteriota archaeon]